MNNNLPKIEYDKKSEVLSIELQKGKSVDSDIQGNMVFDYDKKGNIVRINLYSFNFNNFKRNSEHIKNFSRKSGIPILVH